MAPAMPRRIFLLACAAFFLRFAALAAFAPYIFLWLERNGHDTYARSFLGALHKTVSLAAPLAWGAAADWSRRHRLAFLAASSVNALAVALLVVHPASFGWQAAMLSLAGLTDGGALLDAIVIRCLAAAGAADAAPRSRACGALGWCAVAPLFGALGESHGLRLLLVLYAPLALLTLPLAALLPIGKAYATPPPCGPSASEELPAAEPPAPPPPPASFARRLRAAVAQPGAAGLLLLFGGQGVQMGLAFTFGFIYLDARFHASGVLLGASLTVQAALEVPLFQVAAPLIRRWGFHTAMRTCMLAASLRFAGYVAMPHVLLVLPFELAHGYSFALWYTAMSLYSERFAARGLQATMLGMGNSAAQLGNLLATLLWSVVVELTGLRAAFAVASALFGVAALPLLPPAARGCALWLRTGGYRRCCDCGGARPLLKQTTTSDFQRESSTSACAVQDLSRPAAL
ncbi:hypothetical protein AB1Y20_006211 [Prymnesium parvum]|uniref:Major facilitator superfamily associated domain-containing protein n=1 Tax=Prymnesium parvum TaxID=97485 RepID=A0AB34J2L4_PRYPA